MPRLNVTSQGISIKLLGCYQKAPTELPSKHKNEILTGILKSTDLSGYRHPQICSPVSSCHQFI